MRVFRIQSNARLVISPVFQRLKGIACSIGFRVSCRNIGVRIAHGVTLNAVKLADYVNIAHDAEISHSSIGKRTSIGRYAKVRDAEVGPYCSISWNVTLGAVSHPIERLSTHAFTYRKQFGIVDKDVPQTAKTIRIGHDVWIGCDCVVMPGISIGGGSVVGANSVVTRDVPAYSIVAGNPARIIRQRFDSDVSAALDDTRWWEWDDRTLKRNLRFLTSPVTLESIAAIER